MSIDAATLGEVFVNVCHGMLGLDVSPSLQPADLDNNALVAVVRITGEWNSMVQIEGSNDLARTVGAAMFAQDQDMLSEEEIFDAMGEIANMVGGNVKGIVEKQSALSIPCVGPRGEAGEPKHERKCVLGFSCEGHDINVRLYEFAC